jgi:NTE family protein
MDVQKFLRPLAGACLISLSWSVWANERIAAWVDTHAEHTARPRVGLALSGGGARGFSHVGVLRALEKMRIPVDCIAGTSAGSAVGAAYALGLSPDEIEGHLRSVDWDQDIFNDQPPRADIPYRAKERVGGAPIGVTLGVDKTGLKTATGIFAGQKVELFLHRMLGFSAELDSFDRLPIPFRAVTTDIANGEMVVAAQGSLVHAVRASMAVPSAFAPVKVGDRLLVDGGLTQNLPIDAVRKTCADVVIAVNIGSPLLKPDELGSVFSVALQIVSILMERNVTESLASLNRTDVLITPELNDISAVDFSNGVNGIPAGESATLASARQLQHLSLSESAYRDWQTERGRSKLSAPDVSGVRVATTRFVNPDYFSLDDQASLKAPGPLNAQGLERRILNWTASGDFTDIAYSIRPEQGLYTLWIEPQEKTWGPNYIQLGIAGAVDSHSQADFSVTSLLRRSWQNSSGAEWVTKGVFGKKRQLESFWIQPLSVGSAGYVESRINLVSEPRRVFWNDRAIGEFSSEKVELEIGAGLQGKQGKMQIGILSGKFRRSPVSGFTEIQSVKARNTGIRAQAIYDQLDDLDFPRSGEALKLEGFASARYRRLDIDLLAARSWGGHTLRARAQWSQVSNDGAETLDYISSGGLMRLSGYQSGQFLSRGLALGSLTYYRRIVNLPQPFGTGVFAGASLELGRLASPLGHPGTTMKKSSLALFVGASTSVGPVYLGYGQGERGARNIYLLLGRP